MTQHGEGDDSMSKKSSPYDKLLEIITAHIDESNDFKKISEPIKAYLDTIGKDDFIFILDNIGTIPEKIEHDSTEEKLYSKVSDIVLSKAFQYLGMKSTAVSERGDAADVLAESIVGHNYSLVADAKCFRLSRTAKNQKDFKVSNLSDWRGSENEYAVLVSPYFQYPSKKSQIYSKALDNNVCLFTWEQLSILLKNGVRESSTFSLESLWNASNMMAKDKSLAYANREDCFLDKMDSYVMKKIGMKETEYYELLYRNYTGASIVRCDSEIKYWKYEIKVIEGYTKEQAVTELIGARKINEKIDSILTYKRKLEALMR